MSGASKASDTSHSSTPRDRALIVQTVGMASSVGGLGLGGDVEQALAGLPVPSYVLDTTGVVRWINPAAERLLGDVRGRHFTSVVGPEDKAKAQELFARKVLGTTSATETSGVFVSADGARLTLEVSAVPLMGGERVVGVFGMLTGPLDERGRRTAGAPDAPSGRSAASPRAGTLDEADRPGAPREQRNGAEPRPPLAASTWSDDAPRSSRRRPTRPRLDDCHAPDKNRTCARGLGNRCSIH